MDIFPDGDIVLVVGADSVRMSAHSQCLRAASHVFAAMLQPAWSEGHGLSEKKNPVDIILPEDDSNAMQTVCCIIHHRNELVSAQLTPAQVLQIAVVTDKYDLRIALKFASVGWLNPRDGADRVDMARLMAAAYLFNDAEMFRTNVYALTTTYKATYFDFLDDGITDQIIPAKFYHMLEERRTILRAKIYQLLLSGKNAGCKCGWAKNRSEKYAMILAEYDPVRMLAVPLAEIIKRMQQVSTEDMKRQYCHDNSTFGNYYHEPLSPQNSLQGELNSLQKENAICIDCVHSLCST